MMPGEREAAACMNNKLLVSLMAEAEGERQFSYQVLSFRKSHQ